MAILTTLTFVQVGVAHHGITNFDLNSDVEISGTVTEFAFINPHSWLYLDVVGGDGQIVPWSCELRGSSVLRRSGWSPEMFRAGTAVTVSGSPDRFEPNTCYLGTAVFVDGTRVDRYGQIERPAPEPVERAARLASGAPNIAGDWAAEQRVLSDPRGISGAFLPISVAENLEPGEVPVGTFPFPGSRGTEISLADDPIDAYWNRPSAMELTAAGADAIASFDGASSDNPRLRCETTNILFDWTFETDVNRIAQQEDRITLLYGSMQLERTIHLDLTDHPAGIEPSRGGHSIGRWEDDVLIVDTVRFDPGILSADGRVPHSQEMHVVERFFLNPETMVLVRDYTAEDPLFFEGRYTGRDAVYLADLEYQGSPCDDRSYTSPTGESVGIALEVTNAPLWTTWPVLALVGAGILAAGAVLVSRSRRR